MHLNILVIHWNFIQALKRNDQNQTIVLPLKDYYGDDFVDIGVMFRSHGLEFTRHLYLCEVPSIVSKHTLDSLPI